MIDASVRLARKPFRLSATLLLAGTAISLAGLTAVATPAAAQSFTTIDASGTVVDAEGQPITGAKVAVRSEAQGFTRETTTNRDGTYTIVQLQPGLYTVTVEAPGFETYTEQGVRLATGSSTNRYQLARADGSGEIVVSGRRIASADFDRTTTGAVIDVADVAQRVPVARDLQAVIQLTPGAGAGSGAFGGLSSIRGSSVSENAYFLNGINITNFRNNLAPATIPFDFYQTIEVKTGGYAAEFGRSTGGFTNATSKSGSNEFHGAVRFNWEPDELKWDAPDTRGSVNRFSGSSRTDAVFELGGPIIKDRVFFYGMYNARRTDSVGAGRQYLVESDTYLGTSRTFSSGSSPFYGIKIDVLPFDGQRLEGTYISSEGSSYSRTYGNTNSLATRYDYIRNIDGPYSGGTDFLFGNKIYAGKYTGTFTDWLSVSALYGRVEFRNTSFSINPQNSNLPSVVDARIANSPISLTTPGGGVGESLDKRTQYRADVDIRFNLLGSHHIRFGYDREELFSSQTSIGTGGGVGYRIIRAAANDPRGLAIGTDYLRTRTYRIVGGFESLNEAYYLQDSWSLMEGRLNVNIGVRNDRFSNNNSANVTFYNSGNQWGPRLGFTFDPFGNQTDKVFGSFGRLFMPVASNTNVRLTGGELYFDRYTTFNGLQANNVPIIGTPIVYAAAANCPGESGVRACTIFSDGSPRPAESQVSTTLKPQSVDEYILGFEKQIGLWRLRTFYTEARLNEVLEDVAIDAAVRNYCVAQRISGCAGIWGGFHQYVLVNPGSGATVQLSDPIGGEATRRTVTFSAAELGYPKAVRTARSVTLEVRREFDGVWSLDASWVYGKVIGNYEGGVKTDNGQTDTGLTTDFDQPGLTAGQFGYSPNDRRHVFKLYGSYQLLKNVTVGLNTSLTSPRRFGCIGRVLDSVDELAGGYGAAGSFCQVNPDGTINTNPKVTRPTKLIPRGSVFQSDWLVRNDLDIQLTQEIGKATGYLRVSAFNLLNLKARLNFNEYGTDDEGTASPLYRDVTGYQGGRSIRFQAGINF